MSKISFFIISSILLFTSYILFPETGTIGDLIVTYEEEEIRITVYDISVGGMKGKQVHFGFQLSQDGEWIDDSWEGIEPQTVKYNPAYWNDEAFWCTYTYDYIMSAGNFEESFYCSFFIINTGNNTIIAREDVMFYLFDDDFSYNYEEEYMEDESSTGNYDYDEIIIEYNTAQTDRIKIQNRTIYYTYVVGSEADSPVSANVTYFHETIENEISDSDIQALIDAFYQNGWAQMREGGYGVSEDQRYYPQTIRLKDENGDKIVEYRSGQVEEEYPKPSGYDRIINAIIKMKDKYF